MADNTTPNYDFIKPELSASADTWGEKWNENADSLDTTIKAVSDVANAALPKAGGTLTGDVSGTKFTSSTGFFGNLTGNVTGNLSGNVTGALTGTASAATLAAKASTLASGGGTGAAMTFTFSGVSQPTYLWGTTDGATSQVTASSSLSVATAAACSGNAATATALTSGDKTISGSLSATGSILPSYDGTGNFSINQNGSNPSAQRIINFTTGRFIAWNQSGDTLVVGCGSALITLSGSGRVDITAPGGLYVNGSLMNVP